MGLQEKPNSTNFYNPWSVDAIATELSRMKAGGVDILDQDNQPTSGLEKSTSSDKYGLNSSTSSGGFALDDLVTKILDDDPALFGFNKFGTENSNGRNGTMEQPPWDRFVIFLLFCVFFIPFPSYKLIKFIVHFSMQKITSLPNVLHAEIHRPTRA